MIFPNIQNVSGIDSDCRMVAAAQQSGVYQKVYTESTDCMNFPKESFASVFANCSLEHMDNLPIVLANINKCLKPKGHFLFSVVTDKLIEWYTVANLYKMLEDKEYGRKLEKEYMEYHHLISPLSVENWCNQIEQAGFEIINYIPVMSEVSGKMFLFIDGLWHIATPSGEFGQEIDRYLHTLHQFPKSFEYILRGMLQAEKDNSQGCGAVFYVRKKQ